MTITNDKLNILVKKHRSKRRKLICSRQKLNTAQIHYKRNRSQNARKPEQHVLTK